MLFYFRIFKSNNEVIHAFPLLNPNLKGNDAKEAMNEAFREHGIKVLGVEVNLPYYQIICIYLILGDVTCERGAPQS